MGWGAQWEIQSGVLMTRVQDRVSAPTGFSGNVSQVQGTLGVSRVFDLSPQTKLRSGVFTLLPWRKGKDGNTSTFSTHFALQTERKVSRPLSISGGLGIWWESMVSTEKAIELGNGTGTSEFYTPSRWTQIFVPTLSLGAFWRLGKKWEVQFSGIVPQFLSSTKRQIFFQVSLGIFI